MYSYSDNHGMDSSAGSHHEYGDTKPRMHGGLVSMVLHEPLRRLMLDAPSATFTITEAVAFPLTLSLHRCDVGYQHSNSPGADAEAGTESRAAASDSALFLSFYTPNAGVGFSLSDQLILWMWVPLVLAWFCCSKMCRLDRQQCVTRALFVLGGTTATQQSIAWVLASLTHY